MKPAPFDYRRPDTVEAALAALAGSNGVAKAVAGGQSLGPMLNLRLAQPAELIDLGGIAALRECLDAGTSVQLGAGITHAQIEDGRIPDPSRGLMSFVARGIAYRAVRNRGTLGGSLAHADPAADWINVMALLDATCIVMGPRGQREIAQRDWMVGAFTTALADDEVLLGVRIARLSPGARWSYYKVNRKPGEFAEAICAFVDDGAQGRRRAVIGAIDGAPFVIADAGALIERWDEALAHRHLCEAGLEPGTLEYQLHAVALRRAAAALAVFTGEGA
ncbi:FAD binding domain-containing protein [Cupriavidus cauae]|uniref:FAD binding domain-containing protein n=1 Tax=Cupriavidus TaxID=106589 RepID=UPI001CF17962|nr:MULTISPECIES: FAD binding domain-containing protein [Cupriavidus]MCA7083719.1 FAD binding domain-containing protein [Cupriavidus sp. DB3]UZN52348.1 FAD binding domain-containing protein [Cupriavidus cauae]